MPTEQRPRSRPRSLKSTGSGRLTERGMACGPSPALCEAANCMLGAFLDDSGTHATSTVTTIGGLLGTEVQWEVFVHAWPSRLPAGSRCANFTWLIAAAVKGNFSTTLSPSETT